MSWDSVPWFVGGGAQHSPEVARLLAYAATSGAEGIVTPGDLKVVPLAVPGSSVRVLTGACLILNRNSAGAQQTYVARNPSEDVVGIAATGSTVGRTDLVVAQIKDPFLPGEPWADPSDVTKGPYIFTEVIPNVPTTAVVDAESAAAYLKARGISGLALAAVLLPRSTATVTATEIRDLRRLAQPRMHRELFMTGFGPDIPTPGVSASFLRWALFEPEVLVPSWATSAAMLTSFSGILADPQLIDMQIRTKIGNSPGAAQVIDLDNGGTAGVAHTRESFLVATGADVTSLQGQRVKLTTEIQNARGLLTARAGTHMVHDITFYERAV